MNWNSYTGNVKDKTDEQNITEMKSICLGDWMDIGKAKAGEKKVIGRCGITIPGGSEL